MATRKKKSKIKLSKPTMIAIGLLIIVGIIAILYQGGNLAKFSSAPSTETTRATAWTVHVTLLGDGSGTVTSSDGFVKCPGDCEEKHMGGTALLTATASPNSYFTIWSGCGGQPNANQCIANHDASSITATFIRLYKLTTAYTGSGTVMVQTSRGSCGMSCTAHLSSDKATVIATPAAGYVFSSWTNCDSASGTTCTMTMNADKTVTATFKPSYKLTIAKAGTTGGTVTSSPSGINCGSTCYYSFVAGTPVTLTASITGGIFGGWSGGGCSGLGTCTITNLNADTKVTATFNNLYNIGDACKSNSDCYSGYCNPTTHICQTAGISCGTFTCNTATQKCCVDKCYAKTAICPI